MASLVRFGGNEKHASSQHFLTHHTRTPSQQSAPPRLDWPRSEPRPCLSLLADHHRLENLQQPVTDLDVVTRLHHVREERDVALRSLRDTTNNSQPTRSDLYSDTRTGLTHPSSETERENGYSCRRDLRSIGCGARLRPAPCARPSARCRSRQHPMRCAAPGRRWPCAPCSTRTRPATRKPVNYHDHHSVGIRQAR